ncbi:ABC-2 type transport system permease protein [Glaciihabitans tibetensis]|uniref:ABC-2 type transport system permease protein n=1 Tax=Glaciihabitans tibetensis TaxID=1266600 RepID=A0A2T0VHB0_9MICO|nr:polyketide antibiotic transporter [Glaciihabitans tibetensis]PRY69565.1 ABC-2 type transport system permease protein [Glaciihabitans tibetensis]
MSPVVQLWRVLLRHDRWQLAMWIGGITALAGVSAAAVLAEFSGEAERSALIAVAVSNPAFLFLRGTPDGTSVGALFFFQGFTFISVLAGLMSTFMVVRNTRAEEDSGRAELIAALPLPRQAPLVAAVSLVVLANLLLAVTIAIVLMVVGLDAAGSLFTGLATAGVGIVFTGVAALAALAMPSSRGANGVAASLVGGAYLLRGIGDALGTPSATLTSVEPAWLSWLSPIGWAQRVSPFGEVTALPLLLHLATAGILIGGALVLAGQRDIGSSVLQERSGAARASAVRSTSLGAAWVYQLPALIGWAVGTAVLAALVGVLAPTVASALSDNPALLAILNQVMPGSQTDMVDVFATAILGICGILVAAAGIQAVLRLRAEELTGRAELQLAAPLSRARWLVQHVVVAAATIGVIVVAAGLAAGFAFVLMGEGWERVPSSLSAMLAQIPAALTLAAAAALAFALVPRFTVALGWGALLLAVVLGQFGDLLQLPEWVQDISPFRHTSAMPLESFDPLPAVVMVGVALAGFLLAAAFIERRDIVT